jgi:hypothetical protein
VPHNRLGERKNLFDPRRVVVVRDCHALMRWTAPVVLAA